MPMESLESKKWGKKTVGLGKTEQTEKQNFKASTDQNSLTNKQTKQSDEMMSAPSQEAQMWTVK